MLFGDHGGRRGLSQMLAVGVPLGMEDSEHPNISSTLWRTIADHHAKRYYFESTIKPR